MFQYVLEVFVRAMKAMHGQNKNGLAKTIQSDTSNIDNRQGLKKSWQWRRRKMCCKMMHAMSLALPKCVCRREGRGGEGRGGGSGF